jgi:hypothetical protein
MSTASFTAKGMKTYATVLSKAREQGTSGVYKHLLTPKPATCSLGLKGKPVAKKDRADLQERLWIAALKDPTKMPAALNCIAQWGDLTPKAKK